MSSNEENKLTKKDFKWIKFADGQINFIQLESVVFFIHLFYSYLLPVESKQRDEDKWVNAIGD